MGPPSFRVLRGNASRRCACGAAPLASPPRVRPPSRAALLLPLPGDGELRLLLARFLRLLPGAGRARARHGPLGPVLLLDRAGAPRPAARRARRPLLAPGVPRGVRALPHGGLGDVAPRADVRGRA